MIDVKIGESKQNNTLINNNNVINVSLALEAAVRLLQQPSGLAKPQEMGSPRISKQSTETMNSKR